MLTRRQVLGLGMQGGVALGTAMAAPAIVLAETRRPMITSGVMSGDMLTNRAMIWSRADRPSRMLLEIADNPEFKGARSLRGPEALPVQDLTAKLDVAGLDGMDTLHYRVRFAALGDHRAISEPVVGQLRLPSEQKRDVRFVWSGDTAGQGWGIDESRGGMTTYETMRQQRPDFFIHSGDTVYADGPLKESVELADGSIWRNRLTPAKSKVAETLDEYRGQHAYNLLDANVQRLNAEVPMLAQWDDHETVNNWYPGEVLDDPRYTETNVSLLSARARRAFLEYMPLRQKPEAPQRIHRRFPYGPGLEVFMLDMRSFRGPNDANRQEDGAALLGRQQVDWLIDSLKRSTATWKVIASDMPVGLMVADGDNAEAVANGDPGRPLGREQEIARLLEAIRDNDIRNVVWLTADVHYTAAHHYAPERAAFKNFRPFWEFVSGPLHAGTFGPNDLDATFGPEVVFQKAPPDGQANLPPSAGYQFFGQVDLDGESEMLTVTLKDAAGNALHKQELAPESA
ncbi:alkaline phosphatase D family protein [Halomonas elongata]|uniref:Alkaline phosphatase D family protein n=1 Tax=Halomonas elongata (strain ATCC 33173 / DSM 2581 / NBRC 15536 / NCIMB 2198 / 1H9) TaxID=768066 RepID=E1VBZ8_HALED|nr:alkaline phosphatase D family protein [Halomonas elongata]WBF19541.1 alkaline phosphatase D family protein [Halomonas elongata]WPU48404.1 alkaline phosphatase D family protein [Halomonas elongata DSM 2581]CBV42268.1 phoD family phosphatase [Halomonas elongata DSM 2581]